MYTKTNEGHCFIVEVPICGTTTSGIKRFGQMSHINHILFTTLMISLVLGQKKLKAFVTCKTESRPSA